MTITAAVPPGFAKYSVGLLSFSDGRMRVHLTLQDSVRNHAAVLAEAIARDPLLEAVPATEIAYSAQMARRTALEMRGKNVEAAIFNIPVFAFPNFSLIAARLLGLPVLLSSPKDGTLPGLGGILAAHGGMRQVGIRSNKIWGNPLAEPKLQSSLSAYCRAAGAVSRLNGSVYGLVGGRSIGMNTGAVSAQDWMRQFGVDVEHIDQLELVRRAAAARADASAAEEVERAYAWLTGRVGRFSTEGKAAPENVKEQIRHYIAIRDLIAERGLDFVSLKCHYELSEYFVTGCLSAMLLNDPYDWNGPKPPFVMSCEADSDGALTMQVLKLVSGYPSLLFDVRGYDFTGQVFVCCNCGAQPSWYAARSEVPEENLVEVSLEPVIPKYGGGGAHFPYVCREGEITVARLSRVDGRYRMFLARGEFVDYPREKMAETCAAWPHGYVRMNISPEELIPVFNTNHAHVIPGDHREALAMWCEFMGIPVDSVE